MRAKSFYKIIVGLFAASAAIGSASAADLAARPYTKAPPLSPVYNWTGPYVGIEGGGGKGRSTQTDPGFLLLLAADGRYDVKGGFVGGTLGHNWQMGSWVFGLEGDYSWSDIKGSSNLCGLASGIPHPCGTKLRSFGTARGRVGYTFGSTGNWMLYGTGGLAVGDIYAWDSFTPASGSKFRAGWTAGGGIETAFAPRWTAKLEYLYLDFGKTRYFDVVPGVPETVSLNVHVVRGGINYAFGGPNVPRY